MASMTPYSLPAEAQRRKSSSDSISDVLFSHSPTNSGIKMAFPADIVQVLSSLPQAGQPGTIRALVDLLDISPEYSHLLDVVQLVLILSNSTTWLAIRRKELHKVLSLLNKHQDSHYRP